LSEAAGLRPQSADAQNALGKAYIAAGSAKLAREPFQKAIAINSRFAIAQVNLGAALIEAGLYAPAAAHLDAAFKLLGKRADAAYAHFCKLRFTTRPTTSGVLPSTWKWHWRCGRSIPKHGRIWGRDENFSLMITVRSRSTKGGVAEPSRCGRAVSARRGISSAGRPGLCCSPSAGGVSSQSVRLSTLNALQAHFVSARTRSCHSVDLGGIAGCPETGATHDSCGVEEYILQQGSLKWIRCLCQPNPVQIATGPRSIRIELWVTGFCTGS
jgi:tetratricopeptide (TPR) repeat protein